MVIGATLLLCAAAQLRAATTDWPTHQHDSRHTAYNQEARMHRTLEPSWTISLGTGAWGFASPIYSKGTIYTGSIQGEIRAIGHSAGETRWSFRSEGSVHLAPAAINDKIYFGSTDGRLTALNARTGEPIWSYNTHSNIHSSPNVVDDTVYFASNNGAVYA